MSWIQRQFLVIEGGRLGYSVVVWVIKREGLWRVRIGKCFNFIILCSGEYRERCIVFELENGKDFNEQKRGDFKKDINVKIKRMILKVICRKGSIKNGVVKEENEKFQVVK